MSQSRTTFTARGPDDLIAAVPHVLGFHPEESVVLMTFGPCEAFHARVDLPVDEDAQVDVVELLADVIARHGVRRVALLLYTEDTWVAATFHAAAVPVLVQQGVEVIDVVRVARDRFHDAGDVDDPGTAYDIKGHLFTAEQVLAGNVVHDSRAGLAASLQLVDAADAQAVADAAASFDRSRTSPDLVAEAHWIQRTLRRHVRARSTPSAEFAGQLLVLISIVDLRDVAWAEMSRSNARGHVALWRDLVRRSPRTLLPAAASLLAFAAWLDGHGALAWCALDRCAEVDPAYSMADCIRALLDQAVPPSVWTAITESDLAVFGPPGPEAS